VWIAYSGSWYGGVGKGGEKIISIGKDIYVWVYIIGVGGVYMKEFWGSKFSEGLMRRKAGFQKPSEWSLLYTLILKYEFNISVRGYGIIEIAKRIKANKESFNKLTQEEKEFVDNCFSGKIKK